jgi:uncharacterized protein YndB with AHSA1/START domain
MTVQGADTLVSTSTVVHAPIERAFSVFTEDIGSWWPSEHHILQSPLAEMVFEPRAGGHVYDRGTDGSECRWARVLAYEPPERVVISWDINLPWQIETDRTRTSEVEVRFLAETPQRTRVELGAPQPRAPRRGLGEHARRGRLTAGVGGRDACVRHAPRGLSAAARVPACS